jgi:hypothetical protein
VTPHPLLDIAEVPRTEPYLRTVGEVFRAFRDQDSGCVSYGGRPRRELGGDAGHPARCGFERFE